ncbi:MAG: histidine kinase [Prevotellaceae bacterium]|jgi:signal transduction histidine kinase|nr:histidine kinase [Prevotellaceae bacterium]
MIFFIYILRNILLTACVSLCGSAMLIAGDGEKTLRKEEQRTLDSLKNELKNIDRFTEHQKMMLYSHITGIYASFAMDSVILYGVKTIEIAKRLNEKDILLECYRHVGIAYSILNNYDTAIFILNKARELGVEMQSEQAQESALWLMAFVYANQGKYVTAIDMYLKLLPIYETHFDKYIITHVAALANLAELNRKLGNMNVAMQYLDRAAELGNSKLSGGYRIWRMSQIYNEYSTFYLINDSIGKALEYALMSDSINPLGTFVINKCQTRVLLAKIYLRLNDYELALRYAGEAMESADILKNNNLHIDVWKIISDIRLAQGRYREAETEALKAWNADSTNINESRLTAANIALANIFMNSAEKAAHFFRKYSELNDRYTEKSFHTTISDLSVKYELEKKEMRIESINRQRLLYLYTGIAIALTAIATGIGLLQKVRNERTEQRLVAVKAILEGEDKERQRIARDLHDGLSGMILSAKMDLGNSESTQNVRNILDKCIEEIHSIVTDIAPSSLRRLGMRAAIEECCRKFPITQFHFSGKDRRIDDEKIERTVYYCACELINNSVKHSGATAIRVQLIQESDRIALCVQDNGAGFDKNTAAKGTGLKNINYRIIAFNGTIDIESSPENGTETSIEFKISS